MAGTSTKRWHQWKERQASGEAIVPVPVNHALIELMLDAGKVDEAGSRNRKTLGKAILAIVANALASRDR